MKTIARKTWAGDDGVEHIHDIYLDATGQLAMTSERETNAQVLEATVLTKRGELFYDTRRGIPYFETLFSDPNRIIIWEKYMRDAVTELGFVKEIKSFDIEYAPEKHLLTYKLVVETNEGEVTVEG